MKQAIILAITLILLSCEGEKIDKNEKCPLVKTNGINGLKFTQTVSQDSLTINFQNSKHEWKGYTAAIISKYYDYQLNRRTISFGNGVDNRVCAITLYYPGDSSYFNNHSYIGRFQIRDSDTPNDPKIDSLVFVKQCSFNFYLELIELNGEKYKSIDRNSSASDFFQIDSIKYIKRDKFEFAQYKAYGHFKTLLVDANNKQELITGELKMQFETDKR